MLQKLGLLETVDAVSWQTAGIADEAMAERIRHEILLYDPESRQVFGGIDTITQLAARSPRWRWVAPMLQWPPAKRVLGYFYNLIAANRRILSPIPPQPIPCACDPPDNPAARRQFYLFLGFIIILNNGLFALCSANPQWPWMPAYVVMRAVCAYSLLWLPCLLAILAVRRNRLAETFQQILVASALGSLWLLPASGILKTLTFPGPVFILAMFWFSLVLSSLFFAVRASTLQLPSGIVGIVLLTLLLLGFPEASLIVKSLNSKPPIEFP